MVTMDGYHGWLTWVVTKGDSTEVKMGGYHGW